MMGGLLARHVMQTSALAMLGALVVLTVLQLLFAYLAELGELNAHYHAWQALLYVLWQAPDRLVYSIPIATLMGAVIGLGSLASASELVVMRSVGVSLWRIVRWTMIPALGLVLLSFVLSEWVMPLSVQQAQNLKNNQHTAQLGEVHGYWTREGQRFIFIDYANSEGKLSQVQLIDLNDNYRISRILNAQSGQFTDHTWQLQRVQSVSLQPDGTVHLSKDQHLPISLALQPKFVHMVTVDPEQLAPSELIGFMRYMHTYSQIPKKYQLAFWQKVATPFAVMALLVLACSFVFGPLRQQSMSFRIVMALFAGLGFNYIQSFLGYASLVYQPSAAWFVFIPIALIFAIGSYLLRRVH